MKFQGFVGPAYTLKSVNVDCQRCVNLFPEMIESGFGKEGAVAYLRNTPGLRKLFEVGTGPIRLVHTIPFTKISSEYPENRLLVVSGNKAYAVSVASGVWSSTEIGTLDTSEGPVTCASSGYNESGLIPGFRSLVCDGTSLYVYTLGISGGVLVETLSEYLIPISFKPSHVSFVDGFFICNDVASGQFYVSGWGNILFDPLGYASAEGDPDNNVALIASNRDLYIFNERTLEVWRNTGNADFPFERVPGGFIEKGCVAPYSVAKIDGNVFWLGRDEFGQGQIYLAQGLTTQRISTHAIEQAIQGYPDISNAAAFTYQKNGHSFYQLNFDETSWVFDLSTKMWHERAYTNAGVLERHRADNISFFPATGQHLVGDYDTNVVYALDENYYYDDEAPISKIRTSPHVSASKKRLFFYSLEIDMETGVGLDGDVQGSDPQIMMTFSNDGGHTWSSEMWESAGKKVGGIGDFKKRVRWNRLGSAYDRVFSIKVTDPVPIRIIGAEIELQSGVA